MCKLETKTAVAAPTSTKQPSEYDVFDGNRFQESDDDLTDFIWKNATDEPHASRRKAMLKSHPDLKHLFGHEPLTKYIVMALMSIQLYLAYQFRNTPFTLSFWLTSYFIGATIAQALFLACHEISHNLAFRKFSHNKLFGLFTNTTMLVPFFMYFKQYHSEHHKYQGVDGIDTDLPTTIEAKLLSNVFGKLVFLFFQTWFYAIRPVLVKKPTITKWHVLNYAIQIAFIAAVIKFWGLGSIWYLFASIHFAGSLHPMASHFVAEHYVFKGTEFETFSYYGPLNNLAFNVGYHNEHHDFPTVAWSKLPELKKLLDKDYYSKLPYHKSWTRVLWHFVFDRHIGLFNRIKRVSKMNISQDVKTADNAEYTGAWLDGTGMETLNGETKKTK